MDEMLPWVLPLETNVPVAFNLLGVWADNSSKLRPATAAVRKLADWLGDGRSIVAGGFNNHRKCDHPGYDPRDHKVTMDLLAQHGLVSAHHRTHHIAEALQPADRTLAAPAHRT